MRLKAPYIKSKKANKNSQFGIFNRQQIIKNNNFFTQFDMPMKLSNNHHPQLQATLGTFKNQLKSSFKNKKRSKSAHPQQHSMMNGILTVSQVSPLQIFRKQTSYNQFHKITVSRYTTKSHSINQSNSKFSKISKKNNDIRKGFVERKHRTQSIDYEKYQNYIAEEQFVPIGKLLTKEIEEENQVQFLQSKESNQRRSKTSRDNSNLIHRLNFHNPSILASPNNKAASHKLSLLLQRFRSNMINKKRQKIQKKRSQIIYASSSPKKIVKIQVQKKDEIKTTLGLCKQKSFIEPWCQS